MRLAEFFEFLAEFFAEFFKPAPGNSMGQAHRRWGIVLIRPRPDGMRGHRPALPT